MKKISILLISLLLSNVQSEAQTTPEKKFSVQKTNAEYQSLDPSKATIIWDATTMDYIYPTFYTLPIDFTFIGTKISDFTFSISGGLVLNNLSLLESEYFFGNIGGYTVEGNSFEPNSIASKIMYDTIRVDDELAFVLELSNMGYGMDTDTFSYQIWLYEGTNKVEYRVGYHNIEEGRFSTLIIDEEWGGEYLNDLMYASLAYNDSELSDDPATTNIHIADKEGKDIIFNPYKISELAEEEYDEFLDGIMPYFLTTLPDSSTVLTWNPIIIEEPEEPEEPKDPSSIKKASLLISHIYPNPSKDGIYNIQLHGNNNVPYNVEVIDLFGKIIAKASFIGNHYQMHLQQLPAGSYVMKLQGDGKKSATKITKL